MRSYREQSGLTQFELAAKVRSVVGQGNPSGIGALERADGWVNPRFARAVFVVLNVPEAERLETAYTELKTAFSGVTVESD